MGVDVTHYLFHGWKLPYHDYLEDERVEALVNSQNDFHLISDGMGGEYVMFGKVIDSADYCDPFNFLQVDTIVPSLPQLDVYVNAFERLFGQHLVQVLEQNNIDLPPRLFLFTHFS